MSREFFDDYLRPVAVLTAICLVITVALVFTYELTKPVIAEATRRAADEARAMVLPGAGSFTELSLPTPVENCLDVYRADTGGYVVTTLAQGYGGMMKVMTGLTVDGKITGLMLMDNTTETPGLGSKVGESDHTGKFLGQDAAGAASVAGISGASFSSKGFQQAVATAFAAYELAKGVQ